MTDQTEKVSMLYTQEQVAEMFNVTVQTIYRWRKAGKISAVKVGNRALITWDEIKRVLAENEESAEMR